jgi:hypothetical protein
MGSSLIPGIPMPGTIEPMTEQEAAMKFASLLDAPEGAPAEPAREPTTEATAPAEPEVTEEPATPEQPAAESDTDEPETETPEAAPTIPSTFKYKVDGQEEEITIEEALKRVPFEELQKGISFQTHNTRTAQKLAEERKAAEAELAQVRAEREQYATSLKELSDFLKSTEPKEPDWAALQRDHPDQFPIEFAAWQVRKNQLAQIEAERTAAEAKVQADRQAELDKHLNTEREQLLAKVPEWKDQAKAKAEWEAIVEYAGGYGYSPQDVAAVPDHRNIVILRKAMLYDKAQTSLQKPVTTPAAPVIAPGATASAKKPVADSTRAKQRLAQTGDVNDFADAVLKMGILD